MASEYNQYWYWENMVLSETPLWNNSFKNLSLTKDSIFIYSMIMCKESSILKNSWAYYPSVESLLGFIEHIFMPTAFFTWLDDNEGFQVPVATIGEVLDVMSKEEGVDSRDITSMWEYAEEIQKLWRIDPDSSINNLKDFSKSFNDRWKLNDDKLLYFKIFESSSEIAEFIFTGENNDFFEEIIEEDIGMTKSEWQETCKQVYDNKFLSRRFIDILNNKVGCLV